MNRRKRVTNNYVFRRQGLLMRITQSGLNTINSATDGNGSMFTLASAADSMTNTIQWGNSFVFKLSSIVDQNDFVNLFDRYKIVGVKLKIMYQAESASAGGLGVLPIFNYAIDNDDAAIPSSLNTIMSKQRSKSVVLTANRPISIYVKPKVAVAVYQSLLTGYSSQSSQFINATYPDVQHYGLKTWINNFYAPGGANNQITIQPTYYIACRDPQ